MKKAIFGPPRDPIAEANKYIKANHGRVFDDPQLWSSSKVGGFDMEQGLLGCKDCAIKSCTQEEGCRVDPSGDDEDSYNYMELFKASRAVGSAAEDVLAPKCFDLLELLTLFGVVDETVKKNKKDNSTFVFEGKYCTYMGEHKDGDELQLPGVSEVSGDFPYLPMPVLGKTIAFPSDNVCIDHMLPIKVGYGLFVGTKYFIPPSPLICWRLEDVRKSSFSTKPEVPWVSSDYSPIDGLTGILEAVFPDDFDNKLRIAKAWCKKNGATSASDIVKYHAIEEFVVALTEASITQHKLREKLKQLEPNSNSDEDEDGHKK